jgi:hypothetical protein
LALGPCQRCVLLMNPARISSQFCRAKKRHLVLGVRLYCVGIGSGSSSSFFRGKKALCYRVHALAGSGSPKLLRLFGLGFTDGK